MGTTLIACANRGLGLEIARRLGAEGSSLILACRDTAAAEAVKDEIGNDDVRIERLDFDDPDSVHSSRLASRLLMFTSMCLSIAPGYVG